MALAPGTRLGAYEILTVIGARGMGEVYRARDTRLARDVAVKVIPPAFGTDPESRRAASEAFRSFQEWQVSEHGSSTHISGDR